MQYPLNVVLEATVAKAKQLLSAAHQLYTEVDEPYGIARATGYLGIIAARNNEYEAALALLHDASNKLAQLHMWRERSLFLAELTTLPLR